MLILSRKSGESIVIDGRIHVKIGRVEGDVVKVGIIAPSDVPVHRLEVYEEIQQSNRQALTRHSTPLPRLPVRKAPSHAHTAAAAASSSEIQNNPQPKP
jgi:carbon storage regulator